MQTPRGEYAEANTSNRIFDKDIDIAIVEEQIRNIVDRINPKTGDLASLNEYLNRATKVCNFFRQDQGLDYQSSIYIRDLELKYPSVGGQILETFELELNLLPSYD